MKQPGSIQISIPQPCHEDWSKMTPQDQGRFCNMQPKEKQFPLLLTMRYFQWMACAVSIVFLINTTFSEALAQTPERAHLVTIDKVKRKDSGKILGLIADELGNPLKHVSVTMLINKKIGGDVLTDTDGIYIFKKLPVGNYGLIIQRSGYKKQVVTDVLVQPKHVTEVNVVLNRPLSEASNGDTIKYQLPAIDTYNGGMSKITRAEDLKNMGH